MIVEQIRSRVRKLTGKGGILLVAPEHIAHSKEFQSSFSHYFPGLPVPRPFASLASIPKGDVLAGVPIILADPAAHDILWHANVHDVVPTRNASSAWAWVAARNDSALARPTDAQDRVRWRTHRAAIRRRHGKIATVFGTGPSLGLAAERSWDDGPKVVCNTIVRDRELWGRLSPDVIVAGDALYHFGPSRHARAFREDLARRLNETQSTLFVFPEQFAGIVRDHVKVESDRLVAVPQGWGRTIHRRLDGGHFSLPRLGNVLPLLLLPTATALAKRIQLWGFDGRRSADVGFWANSNQHTYSEFLPELRDGNPAFFASNVPASNPRGYQDKVLGPPLEKALQRAEATGWSFTMLHDTTIAPLARRRTKDA